MPTNQCTESVPKHPVREYFWHEGTRPEPVPTVSIAGASDVAHRRAVAADAARPWSRGRRQLRVQLRPAHLRIEQPGSARLHTLHRNPGLSQPLRTQIS